MASDADVCPVCRGLGAFAEPLAHNSVEDAEQNHARIDLITVDRHALDIDAESVI